MITGATGGMGALFVERFLINGDIVIATDTSDELLRRLAAMAAADGRLATIAGDLSEEDHGLRVAALARQNTGRVDILVNAAGFFPVQSFLEMASHDWRRVVDISLTGAALIAKAVLPLMLGRGWGRIVNIGSASVYEGVPGQAHYVAAKSGVIGLSRSLAREFGEAGITRQCDRAGPDAHARGPAQRTAGRPDRAARATSAYERFRPGWEAWSAEYQRRSRPRH